MRRLILRTYPHDYLDVDILALRAARSLEESDYEDCVYGYGETVTMYAKKNKASISVVRLT